MRSSLTDGHQQIFCKVVRGTELLAWPYSSSLGTQTVYKGSEFIFLGRATVADVCEAQYER